MDLKINQELKEDVDSRLEEYKSFFEFHADELERWMRTHNKNRTHFKEWRKYWDKEEALALFEEESKSL